MPYMNTGENMQERLIQRVNELCKIANEKLGREFPVPSIRFDLRGTTAGTANAFFNWLNFNVQMAIDNEDDFFNDAVPHELSHIIAVKYFNCRAGHNREWRYIMEKVFGVRANRCHNMNVENCRVRRTFVYRYRCKCEGGTHAGAKHHNLIQQGRILICRKCRTSISASDLLEKLDRHTRSVVG